jgi:hypothetical protein
MKLHSREYSENLDFFLLNRDGRVSISPKIFLRSEVLVAVVINVTFLWDTTPCRCVGCYRTLGGTC